MTRLVHATPAGVQGGGPPAPATAAYVLNQTAASIPAVLVNAISLQEPPGTPDIGAPATRFHALFAECVDLAQAIAGPFATKTAQIIGVNTVTPVAADTLAQSGGSFTTDVAGAAVALAFDGVGVGMTARYSGTGNIRTIIGGRAFIEHTGTGTVDTGVGFSIETPILSGGGTLTTGVQLLIKTVPAGWGGAASSMIRQEGTVHPNRFAARTMIGTLVGFTGAETLLVSGGDIRVNAGNLTAPLNRVFVSDGTAALPSGPFVNDTNTGWFRPGGDIFSISAGAVEGLRVAEVAGAITVSVFGKLTVTGIIDPTGIVVSEQTTVPGGAPGAGNATWWARDDVPNVPMFTDDAGVDHVLLFAGGSGLTLDNAYNGSGGGAGRVITVDSGAVQLTGAASANVLATDEGAGNLAALFSDGDMVLGAATMSTTERLRVVGAAASANAVLVDQSFTAAVGGAASGLSVAVALNPSALWPNNTDAINTTTTISGANDTTGTVTGFNSVFAVVGTGTYTSIIAVNASVSITSGSATATLLVGLKSAISNGLVGGTITKGIGYLAEAPTNFGTFTEYNGIEIEDPTGIATTSRAIRVLGGVTQLSSSGSHTEAIAVDEGAANLAVLFSDGDMVLNGNAMSGIEVLRVVGGSLLEDNVTITQQVDTSGTPTALTLTGAAHTTLAAGVEAIDVNYNLARTVQFATGAIATQRAYVIQAPTYAFVAASTITTAATLAITGAPIAGANATITNAFALDVTGATRITGKLTVTGLVDPTGLVLTEQGTVPGGTPAAGDLTLWAIDDAPNRLAYTDDTGVDRRINDWRNILMDYSRQRGMVSPMARINGMNFTGLYGNTALSFNTSADGEDNDGTFFRFITSSTLGSIADLQTAGTGPDIILHRMDWQSVIEFKFKLGSVTGLRFWCGVFNADNPVASDTPGVSLGIRYAGMRFSTDVPDTNYEFGTSNGVGEGFTDSGVAAAVTAVRLIIELDDDNTEVRFTLLDANDLVVATATRTTDLPTSSTPMSAYIAIENRSGGSTESMQVYRVQGVNER